MGKPGPAKYGIIRDGIHRSRRRTRGSETSQYPQAREINRDSPSSGERTGKSPNRRSVSLQALLLRGCGMRQAQLQLCTRVRNYLFIRIDLESSAVVGESPVGKKGDSSWTYSRVRRDTRNPVGIWVDHHPRLNTHS